MQNLEKKIIDISFRLKLSHIGSCLTALPIIEGIYKRKKSEEKFILSCGHAHLAHAVVMEEYGIIESAEENIKKHGIHCERAGGCDVSTGSLGQGLPIALGMAIADWTKNVYCLISDGESTEGSVYEALNIKKKYNVTNLKVYCNFNGWGAYDKITGTIDLGIICVNTSDHWFIKQYGQEAHYKALNSEEYAEIIRQHFA
jgi:transketolase